MPPLILLACYCVDLSCIKTSMKAIRDKAKICVTISLCDRRGRCSSAMKHQYCMLGMLSSVSRQFDSQNRLAHYVQHIYDRPSFGQLFHYCGRCLGSGCIRTLPIQFCPTFYQYGPQKVHQDFIFGQYQVGSFIPHHIALQLHVYNYNFEILCISFSASMQLIIKLLNCPFKNCPELQKTVVYYQIFHHSTNTTH